MSFQPIFPLWAIVIGFLLVFTGLAWLEARRPMRWRSLRLAALLLALSAIAGLLLGPAREKKLRESPILLLTKGYSEPIADSLLTLHADWRVYRTADADRYPQSKQVEELIDLSALGRQIGAIVGEGLPAYALEYLGEAAYQFYPAPLPNGIQSLANEVYTKGQANHLRGHYLLAGGPTHLVLKGPAGEVDSIVLHNSGRQDFSLSFTPKSAGRWQYQLLEKDSTGRLLSEALLPVVVKPETQLRIFILQAFPTFEIRSLKDFLSEREHAVAVRSQVSRNDFHTEFANLPEQDLSRLNNALLDNFDLLIMDAAAFDLLSRTEQSNVSAAIEGGLGFLGLINGESTAFRQWLGLTNITTEIDTLQLENQLLSPAYPVSRRSEEEWYDVLRTPNNRPVAAYFYRGLGKIGFQSIQESYAYLLRGDSLAYASLWMPVLEGTMREALSDFTIELLSDQPLYAGEPVDFQITAKGDVGTVFVDSLPVPLRESPYLDGVWYGRSWPSAVGWHRIEVGTARLDFYAFPDGTWPSVRKVQIQQHTFRAINGEGVTLAAEPLILSEPISRLCFYALFLLAAGFLWLAPKL